MKDQLVITVNNHLYKLPQIPGEKLSSLLRKRLHLTGTKVGCGEGTCGTCTVLIDWKPVLSCVFPAERANGKNILTIEGLAQYVNQKLKLHPLQEAFIDYGAVQCGFCTPGQIITAAALLKKNPNPSSSDIRKALKNRLCRCGTYPALERAILAAARTLLTGEPLALAQVPESINSGKVIGRVCSRPDSIEKVTGKALFTDDLIFNEMLYARAHRAMVPHGILTKIDVSKARSLPGVVAVLTADDIPGKHFHGLVNDDWPVMVAVGERVRYMGDAIAIVAAETQAIADQACILIETQFDQEPIITDPIQARQDGQPKLYSQGNLLKHIKVRKGDINVGFKHADAIIEKTFNTQITDHAFLEPECSIAVPTTEGRMEIYVGSQIPYADRKQAAQTLGWPQERVRIIGQLMGGGFGGKEDIAGQIHAALLANVTSRPVKLLFDRKESFLVHPKRHATQISVKIGAKRNGQLTAITTELYGDTGAYASLGEKVMTRATTHSAGPYVIPNVQADCFAMFTNNPPAGAFRGFGVTQSTFAIESAIDMLAEELDIDPVELRRMNALQVGRITNTGQVLKDSVGLIECIDRVNAELRKLNPQPFKPIVDLNHPHLVRAWGIAVAYKNTGLGGSAIDQSSADVELLEDGTFEVRSSAAELGQGLVTVMRMIVAEEMSIEPEKVRVLVMDTDLTPDGGPTTASRQTYVTGNASRLAAISLRNAITSFLSEKYDIAPDKILYSNNGAYLGDITIPFVKIANEMKTTSKSLLRRYKYTSPQTQPLGTDGDMHFAFSFCTQAAEVEVNTLTGEVRVMKIIAANDVGMAINPLGLQGQVEGGIIMGLGNCLTEEFVMENGKVITDKLKNYQIPGIMLTPEITSFIIEHPTGEGPYGAKGVGEISSIPTTPAITNAIYNAVGVRINRTPVDPQIIINHCRSKNQSR